VGDFCQQKSNYCAAGHGWDQPFDYSHFVPYAQGPCSARQGGDLLVEEKRNRVPERSLVEPLGEARRSQRVVQSVDRSSHHNQKKKQKQKQNENE
jgi:hypothetical protein